MGEEAKIEKKAKEYAQSKDCYVRKFKSPSNRAVPDRLFQTPNGKTFFIEFKAPGKIPTETQFREINLINRRNGAAFWVNSLEQAIKIIDDQLGK